MPDLTLDEKVTLLLHSPRPFEAWLRAFGGPVVGGTGAPRVCPLANFLNARLGLGAAQDVRVFGHHVAVFHTWTLAHGRSAVQILCSVALPHWSRHFVQAIDATGKTEAGLGAARPVLRDEALQQLAAVTAPEDATEAPSKEMASTRRTRPDSPAPALTAP